MHLTNAGHYTERICLVQALHETYGYQLLMPSATSFTPSPSDSSVARVASYQLLMPSAMLLTPFSRFPIFAKPRLSRVRYQTLIPLSVISSPPLNLSYGFCYSGCGLPDPDTAFHHPFTSPLLGSCTLCYSTTLSA